MTNSIRWPGVRSRAQSLGTSKAPRANSFPNPSGPDQSRAFSIAVTKACSISTSKASDAWASGFDLRVRVHALFRVVELVGVLAVISGRRSGRVGVLRRAEPVLYHRQVLNRGNQILDHFPPFSWLANYAPAEWGASIGSD